MHEVTLRFDWDNELVKWWFRRLLSTVNHPQYQGSITVSKPVATEENDQNQSVEVRCSTGAGH